MAGGTLVVSRDVKLHRHFKGRLEALGYRDVACTATEKDGLYMEIDEARPKTVFMEADFYDAATPYLFSFMARRFGWVYFAVFSRSRYPADRGMCFIVNGAKSFLYYPDGPEQFERGLECVRDGKNFISDSVQERFSMRDEKPRPAVELTGRELEVIRFVCNGYTGPEIADRLCISLRTVDFHKREIYTNLSVRNEIELIRVAIYLGLVGKDELNFYGGGYELSPKINKRQGTRDKRKERAKNKE